MSIRPLPETTVRLLSSSQALTTPTSLVKELIDNSLDARATTVEVIISPNTLDRIEVRDNGHGIPLEDFDALGKRGYTSKLRSFEELKSIGGISLGFRGEALFSAVQLGKVSITSKSEGEHVATQAQLKPLGGVDTKVSTSLPIGTTVCVTEFLYSIPVRKQTCLKEASKTLGKLKELLRAYSLARPHIKFSLKLSKGGKFSWNYSPPRNNSIREAVSQIISRELASQCMEKSIVLEEETLLSKFNNRELAANKESSDKNQFVIKIFIPKPTADFSKVSHGQYISIDGRPVSHDKGTMKKIVTIFKHHIRNCLPDTKKLCNPFLYMSMKLPVESYDPNVEPAKDDVLFVNENFVLENIEKVFKDIYDEYELSAKNICTTPEVALNNNGLLMTPQSPSLTSSEKTRLSIGSGREYSDRTPNYREELNSKSSHLGLEEEANNNHIFQLVEKANESMEVIKGAETPTISIAQTKNITCTPDSSEQNYDINKVNPWLIAKKGLPKLEPKASFESSPIESKGFRGVLPTPQPSSDPAIAEFETCDLIEAEVKSPKKRKIIHCYENGGSLSDDLSKCMPNFQDNLTGNYKPITDNCLEGGLFIPGNTTACPTRHHDFVSARQLIDSQTSPRIPFESHSSKQQKIINKPFKMHINNNREGTQGKLHQTLLTRRNCEKNQNNEINSELEWNMDYEYRKEEATKKFRNELGTAHSIRSSPHTNRYKAAALALDVNSCLDQPVAKKLITYPKVSTTLSDDDPRGYYIRRQKSLLAQAGKTDGPKISRAKSLRLPLEHIPANQELHHKLIKIPLGMEQVKRLNRLFMRSDEFIQRGNQAISLAHILKNPDGKEKKDLIRLVKYLIGKKWNDDNLLPFNIQEIEFKFNHFIMDES